MPGAVMDSGTVDRWQAAARSGGSAGGSTRAPTQAADIIPAPYCISVDGRCNRQAVGVPTIQCALPEGEEWKRNPHPEIGFNASDKFNELLAPLLQLQQVCTSAGRGFVRQ